MFKLFEVFQALPNKNNNMSQYVPSCDFEEISRNNHVDITKPRDSFAFNGSVTDYEVETVELKWKNGQLVFHDLRQPRAPFKPPDFPKPSGAAGTLESIINKSTTSLVPQINNASIINTNSCHGGDHAVVDAENLVPWFEDHCVKIGGSANGDAGGKVPVDASLVPSRVENNNDTDTTVERGSNCPVINEDTVNNSSGVGWTLSSSSGALGSTFSGKSTNSKTTYTVDDYGRSNSLCSGEPQKRKIGKDDTQRKRANIMSSVSTKASRAAAVHNQSGRKRRDKINHRMKALQKLVPNSNKNDKSSMLDEVIEYLKQLQSRVNAVKRMNSMSSMMLPSLAMQQQQFQMSMMNPLGMGNHAMDINTMMAPMHNLAAIPSVIPLPPTTALLPINPWEASGVDPFAAFAACHQSQPMTMDAYGKMAAALYLQQSNNPPGFMG